MNINVGPAELETNILKYKSVLFTLSKNIFMNINVRLAELERNIAEYKSDLNMKLFT